MTGRDTPGIAAGAREKGRGLDLTAAAEYALRFALAFILSRGRLLGAISPFGVGFAACVLPGTAGAVTAIGAGAGYVSLLGLTGALKYISVIILIRSAVWIMEGSSPADKPLFVPAVTCAAAGAVGFVYAAAGGWQPEALMFCLTETFLCGGMAYFYGTALDPRGDGSGEGRSIRISSALILLTSVLLSASDITLFGVVSAGRCLAAAAVMLCALLGGPGRGAAAGFMMGAAMDLAAGTAPFFCVIYPLAAVISGVFSRSSRLLFLLAFIAADALGAVWVWAYGPGLSALYETFVASVTVMVLPSGTVAKLGVFFPSAATGYGFFKAREYAREKVELTAEAFRELYGVLRSAREGDTGENVSVVFDRAVEAVCRKCPRAGICWQRDYNDSYDIMNNLSGRLLDRGEALTSDFPARFIDACIRFPELLTAVNGELRLFITRRQFRRHISDNRAAACSQYGDVAAVLKELGEELGGGITVEPGLERRVQKYLRGLGISASAAVFRVRGSRLRVEITSPQLHMLTADREYLDRLAAVTGTSLYASASRTSPELLVLLETEPMCAVVGSACVKRQGQSVSGDKGVFFRTDEGLLYLLLCDGMGSGEGAARASAAAAGIMQKLLRAGVSPELSLRMLGDVMLLKNEGDTDASTVDLMCVDLFTGEARVFKYGAAPSYVKHGGAVRRFGSASFSAGLLLGRNGSGASSTKLAPGDLAVLVTDGVIPGGDDKWLTGLIASYSGDDPKELSRAILRSAVERGGCGDDMTAVVIAAGERKTAAAV